MKINKVLMLLSGLLYVSSGIITTASADFTLGITAPRGELKAKRKWNDFAKYLSQETGQNVKLRALPPRGIMGAIENGEIDILLTNPVLSAKAQKLYNAKVLATLNKKSGPIFAGVIVSKKGSGITKGRDLKGKKVMSLKFRAAAGAYTFQTYHLQKIGINPHKDFASMRAGRKQDDLVLAVKAGVIDAAFIRTGILESMSKEGKINMDDFTIVDQHPTDEIALAHTTDHYPEWYLVALNETSSDVAKSVKRAALALQESDAVAQKANIKGFVDAVPLKGMIDALTALNIAPFKQ